MSYFLNQVGCKIKGFRENKGFTQEYLAEVIDVSVKTIGMWENGKSFIEYPSLLKLCKALEIEEADIFCFPSRNGDSYYEKSINLLAKLSPLKQKQILEIIKTFID